MAIIGDFPSKMGSREIPAWIGFQATAGDNTLHLRTQANGYDCTIDWGDGNKTTAPAGGGNVIHSYASAGLYDIKISGKSFAGFYVNGQTGREKYVAAYSMGKWEVDTLTSCSELFYACSNLNYIHEDLFRYNKLISNFQSCFMTCTSITVIPPRLFRNNTNATNLSHCFRNCSSIKEIPFGLFHSNVLAQNFNACFDGCTALVTIPDELFKYNTAALSFSGSFTSCESLAAIPENIFKYNTSATDFSVAFSACIKLSLRADIFGADYEKRFNGKIVNFQACFNRKSFIGTQGTAPELWQFAGLTSTKTSCFGGAGNSATSLTNYASIPADWK